MFSKNTAFCGIYDTKLEYWGWRSHRSRNITVYTKVHKIRVQPRNRDSLLSVIKLVFVSGGEDLQMESRYGKKVKTFRRKYYLVFQAPGMWLCVNSRLKGSSVMPLSLWRWRLHGPTRHQETLNPVIQCHSPKDLNIQLYWCTNFKTVYSSLL